MKTKSALIAWCLSLGIIVCGCTGTYEREFAADNSRWTEWSNGVRIRVAPMKPVFAATETVSFWVELQSQKPVDANIPYLIPSGTHSVIGPFTMLEVWVTNLQTGARHRDELSRLSVGRHFAFVPKGSSLERISPNKNVTTTFLLRGPFMPAQTVETLHEAREKNACIALDLLPKSLSRLPAGKYTLSLTIKPCPLEGRPDYIREAMQKPPKEYRNVWTGTLTVRGVAFEISKRSETTEPSAPADADEPRR